MKMKLILPWNKQTRTFSLYLTPFFGIEFTILKKQSKPKWALHPIKKLKKFKKYNRRDFREFEFRHDPLAQKVEGCGNHDMILINRNDKTFMTFYHKSPFGIELYEIMLFQE